MVNTVRPNAKATPRKPIPRLGKAAASTAAPQPPKTSQNVPKNSATTRRDVSLSMGRFLLARVWRITSRGDSPPGRDVLLRDPPLRCQFRLRARRQLA